MNVKIEKVEATGTTLNVTCNLTLPKAVSYIDMDYIVSYQHCIDLDGLRWGQYTSPYARDYWFWHEGVYFYYNSIVGTVHESLVINLPDETSYKIVRDGDDGDISIASQMQNQPDPWFEGEFEWVLCEGIPCWDEIMALYEHCKDKYSL